MSRTAAAALAGLLCGPCFASDTVSDPNSTIHHKAALAGAKEAAKKKAAQDKAAQEAAAEDKISDIAYDLVRRLDAARGLTKQQQQALIAEALDRAENAAVPSEEVHKIISKVQRLRAQVEPPKPAEPARRDPARPQPTPETPAPSVGSVLDDEFVRRHPGDSRFQRRRGLNRFGRGDYRGAFSDLDEVIKRGDADAEALTTYGRAAYHYKDYALARDAAALALKMEPGNQAAFAIRQLSEGRASAVRLPSALGGLGAADGGGAAPARGDGTEASGGGVAAPVGYAFNAPTGAPAASGAAQGPSPVQQSLNAAENARHALAMRDFALAAQHASKAIELNPQNAQALNYRAIAYNRLRRYSDAVTDASAALNLAPNNGAALQTRSWAFAQQKQYREALHDADATLSVDPRNPFAYQNKAFALAGLGDRAGAVDALRLSAALDARFTGQYERALQLPQDQDLTLLFDEGTGSAAAAPAAAPARPIPTKKRFVRMALLSATGGLLIALGILHVVSASWREKVRMTVRRALAPSIEGGQTGASAAVSVPGASAFWTQYELVKEIGMGGMGVVYEAVDRSLERRVAVKKMRDEIRVDAHERRRFVNEAKVVASLRHPNIVDIYAIVEDGSDVYLVFEYVSGRTLHDRLRSQGAFGFVEGLKVFRDICGAVEHAHAAKIVHRDLKPSNVMVTSDGRIKVMDFGVARQAKDALTKLSMTNTVVGTPPYMAPEQEQGTVRRESDVYALGVCFYEMLTGQLPFAGSGSGMLLNKINGKHIPPTQRVPSLPQGLDAVMARALQPDPDKRYRTPSDFLADLERLS